MAWRKSLAEREVAGDGPDLDERLPLPGAAERVVVGQRAGQRPGQRAAVAFRPQPQIDAVGQAAVGVGRQQPHHLADDRAKNSSLPMLVIALAAGRAFLVVEEHQVDVAAVVQLLAAVLAEGEDDARDRPAGRGAGSPKRLPTWRRAMARATSRATSATREMSRVISSSGRSRMMSLVPMRSSLPLAEAAEGAQDGRVLVGGVDLGLELVLQLGRARAAAQRHAQHVEVIGIGHEQVAEQLAGAEELQQDFQGAGAAFEQRAAAGRRRRGWRGSARGC